MLLLVVAEVSKVFLERMKKTVSFALERGDWSVSRTTTIPGTEKSKHMKRFPRLELDRDMKLAEKILRITYNSIAGDRIHWNEYDLYKTKLGLMAPVKFSLLGQILVEKKIDPALYLKVLCKYGVYSRSRYLPHVNFLASEEALKVYEWVHQSLLKKYPSKKDFKEATSRTTDKQIYHLVRNSALMVKDVRKSYNLKIVEASVFLKTEISPWYWAWVISSVKRELAEELLEWLVYEEKDLKKKIMRCTKFYVENIHVWREAKRIIRKSL